MNPSPAAISAIMNFVSTLAGGWNGNNDQQIVAAANAVSTSYPNPIPQGTVPVPYTFATLLGALSQASVATVESFPGISPLFDDILAQNSPRILAAVGLLAASGRITSGEAAALEAALTATQADPNWQAYVGWAQFTLGRPLDLNDSATARANQ